MTWTATLSLHYTLVNGQSVLRHKHDGPLRVLKSLYPESPVVCHNVLVHPPSGVAGGDRLEIDVTAERGSHGLISTPGASRFYRCEDNQGVQDLRLHLEPGARLEWLPMETLIYPGAQAENRLTIRVAPGASLIGWDVLGLGLPFAGQPFDRGHVLQRIEWPGVWLESAHIDAMDKRLLDSPLGLAGHRCLATMFYASGEPLTRVQRESALEQTREVINADPLAHHAGATMLNDQLLVVRALASVTGPASLLLQRIWMEWRRCMWQMPATRPRIWSV